MKIKKLIKLALVLIAISTGATIKSNETAQKNQYIKITKSNIKSNAQYGASEEEQDKGIEPKMFKADIKCIDDLDNKKIAIHVNKDAMYIKTWELGLLVEFMESLLEHKITSLQQALDEVDYLYDNPHVMRMGAEYAPRADYNQRCNAVLSLGTIISKKDNKPYIRIAASEDREYGDDYLAIYLDYNSAKVLARELKRYEKSLSAERKGKI